ncbi:MAG: TasA family protein, partial [Ilumatobacteraceae bacterium]
MKTSTARFSMGIGGGLLAIAAMGTLVIGSTLALFSASETSGANAFASGTVTVGLGDTSSVVCNVSGMAPGDSSKAAATGSKTLDSCSYNVKYTGSSAAWLAVDVAVATTGTNLYTAGANGLQFGGPGRRLVRGARVRVGRAGITVPGYQARHAPALAEDQDV